MRRIRNDKLIKRTREVLAGNEGASLILVCILAIIVLTAVVVLRITTSTFLASSGRQLNQDQAYELAASLGESIDIMVERGDYDIFKQAPNTIYDSVSKGDTFTGLPADSKVVAKVSDISEGKRLTVTANVGDAEYVYEKDYRE